MTAPAIVFKPATRQSVKLKIGIDGASGSGKTEGALAIASGICPGGRIALADSENESASLYSDRYSFDTINLTHFDPEYYKAVIDAAVAAKYDALVIDTISHAWFWVQSEKEKHELRDPKANPWTLWRVYGPKWDGLMAHILRAPIHIIATMRSKQAYEQVEQGGRKKVVKMGMAPQVRDGAEYEFSLVFSVNEQHWAEPTKNRTSLFIAAPGEPVFLDFRSPVLHQQLLAWMNEGGPRYEPAVIPNDPATPTRPAPAAASPMPEAALEHPHGSIEWAKAVRCRGRLGGLTGRAPIGQPLDTMDSGLLERAALTFQADDKKDSQEWRVEQMEAISLVLASRRPKPAPPPAPAPEEGEQRADPTSPASDPVTPSAPPTSLDTSPASSSPITNAGSENRGVALVLDRLLADAVMPLVALPFLKAMPVNPDTVEVATAVLQLATRAETPHLALDVRDIVMETFRDAGMYQADRLRKLLVDIDAVIAAIPPEPPAPPAVDPDPTENLPLPLEAAHAE